MSEVTRFRVRLHSLRGHGLPAMDMGGKSDPYLVINFDNWKELHTSVIKQDLNPVWKDEFEFVYETRQLAKLLSKEIVLDCWDKDLAGADYIGRATLDLYTAAVGPTQHILALRDKGADRGKLSFSLEFEMIGDVSLQVDDVMVELDDGAAAGAIGKDLRLTYTLDSADASPATCTLAPSTSSDGTWTLDHGDKTPGSHATLAALTRASIVFKIMRGDASIVGTATVPAYTVLSLVGDREAFAVDITGGDGYSLAGMLQGSLKWVKIPQYAQMVEGLHNDTSIVEAQYLLDDMPNKPFVPVSFKHGAAPALVSKLLAPPGMPKPTQMHFKPAHRSRDSDRGAAGAAARPLESTPSHGGIQAVHAASRLQILAENDAGAAAKHEAGESNSLHATAAAQSNIGCGSELTDDIPNSQGADDAAEPSHEGGTSVDSAVAAKIHVEPDPVAPPAPVSAPQPAEAPATGHVPQGSITLQLAPGTVLDAETLARVANIALAAQQQATHPPHDAQGAPISRGETSLSSAAESPAMTTAPQVMQVPASTAHPSAPIASLSSMDHVGVAEGAGYGRDRRASSAASSQGPAAVRDRRSSSHSSASTIQPPVPSRVSLPWFWARALDGTGRPYFSNHVTRATVWELPTENEYDITFPYPGPLGIELESRFPLPAGMTMPGPQFPGGAYVKQCVPGSSADAVGRIKPGHFLMCVNQFPVHTVPFESILQMLGGAGRPLVLRFLDPFAVSSEMAAAAVSAHAVVSNEPMPVPIASPPRRASAYETGAHMPAGPYGSSPYGPTPGAPAARPHFPLVSAPSMGMGMPVGPYGAVSPPYGVSPSYGIPSAYGAPGPVMPPAATAGYAAGPYACGWVVETDPASGRQYYAEPASGRTSWTWPPS